MSTKTCNVCGGSPKAWGSGATAMPPMMTSGSFAVCGECASKQIEPGANQVAPGAPKRAPSGTSQSFMDRIADAMDAQAGRLVVGAVCTGTDERLESLTANIVDAMFPVKGQAARAAGHVYLEADGSVAGDEQPDDPFTRAIADAINAGAESTLAEPFTIRRSA